MAFSRVFCGFLASLMIVFTAHNTFAAGYMCTRKYTGCNSGYYMTGSSSSKAYNSTVKANNACQKCPTGITCDSGIKAPYFTVSFNENGAQGTVPDAKKLTFTTNQIPGSNALSTTMPTKNTLYAPNYYFLGWGTAGNHRYEYYETGDSVDFTQSTTMYAIWGSCAEDTSQTYPYSAGTGTAVTSCYRNCTSNDIPHAATFTSDSKVYSNSSGLGDGTKSCTVNTCDSAKGYNLYNNTCDSLTITLNKNGGTGGTSNIYSTSVSVPSQTTPMYIDSALKTAWSSSNFNIPTRTGYTFQSYNDTAGTKKVIVNINGTPMLYPCSNCNFLSAPTTWYAQWTPNTYLVTLENQGADIAAGTAKYYYQYKTKGKCYYYTDSGLQTCIAGTDGTQITIPQKKGFKFDGYFTGTNGTGTQYVDESGLTVNNLYNRDPAGDITLYAKWSNKSYNVNYSCGTGSGTPPTATTVIYNNDFTTAANTSCTKTGYSFNGWKVSGTNDIKNANSTFKWQYDGNKTLEAQWTPGKYTITLDDNGGTGGSGTLTETYATGWNPSSATVPTRNGYTFRGYYTAKFEPTQHNNSSSTTDQRITKSGQLPSNTTFTSNATLYAAWAQNCANVEHGWCNMTVSDNGVVKYDTGCDTGYKINTYGSATPICTAITFTINYDLNKPIIGNGYVTNASAEPNRNGGVPTRIQTYDGTYVAPTNPTLTGWMFQGWGHTANNATETPITDDEFKTLLENDGAETTVYAIWKPIEFKVQYNANKPEIASGTVGNMPENITCTYDMDCDLSGTPTLTGWTFDGWYATSDNANDPVTNMNNATTTNGATVNVYAKWTVNTYTITFEQTGGTGGTEKMDVIYDNTVKSITTPMKPGHTFAGYYADGIKYFDEYGNYAILNVDNQWRHADNIPLFAAWTICPAGSYCPGNTSLEKYSCADLERVPTQMDDESVENPRIGYWSGSDEGAINATDCYRVCKQDRSPIIDNKALSNGHGILMCVTGKTNNAGECIANHAQSCTYNAVCDDGYEEVYRGTERAYCKPRGYNVTFDNNGGVGLVTLPECTVGTNCVLPGVKVDDKYVLTRTGYVFTGWSLSSDGSTGILPAGTDLLRELNPTGSLTFYAIWGLCDLGYYWNGLNGSAGACVACPLDSYQDDETPASGNAGQCNLCAPGYYTEYVASTNVNNCTRCPAGSYCTNGFGLQSCPAYPNSDVNFAGIFELTGKVYTSDIGNAEINGCYFDCPEFDVEYGHATPDVTRINRPDECKYTCVSVTGNPGHVENGRCKEDSCNPEYEMKNGICTECNRENAMSYRAGGNCVIDACVDGYHPDYLGKSCILNEAPCDIANAIEAKKIWNSVTGDFDVCKPIKCYESYHIEGNLCVSDTRDCTVDNGTGQQEWDTVHNRWGACQVTTCKPGYTSDPYESNEPTKKCGECRNKYGINSKVEGVGTRAVASYETGCEIARCEFQGELYNLDGNECVPICTIEEHSDETGYMKWNPNTHKCERTCYTDKGYVSWETPLRPGN